MPLRTWRKLKGAEVLGLSLTELLLLLTFALLLVMSIFFKDLRATSAVRDDLPRIARSADEISKKADEVSQTYFGEELDNVTSGDIGDQIDQGNEVLNRFLDEATGEAAGEVLGRRKLPDVWTTLVRAEADADELAKLKKERDRLMRELKERESLVEQLTKSIADKDRTLAALLTESTAEKQMLIDENKKIANALDLVQAAMKEAGANDPGEFVGICHDNRGQLKNLQRRCGLEMPPCWATAEGRIEFAYLVTVRSTDLLVEPTWPPHRSSQRASINAPAIDTSTEMSLPKFRSSMRPFYDWGRFANPECRFSVKVRDGTGETEKKAWQDGLDTVESIFYKRIVK